VAEIKEIYYTRSYVGDEPTEWKQVSEQAFIDEERGCGFYPKGGSGVATGGFSTFSHGFTIEGKIEYSTEGE